MSKIELSKINEEGYYEIRLESVGGLGANLCGKLLGELGAIYLGLNAASFSSYGSEKRGSPVKAFIRYCNQNSKITVNTPVTRPHLLGLFHEAMIGKMQVTAGVDENSSIVINTGDSPEQIRDKLRLCAGTVYCIDAIGGSMKIKCKINMIMLGALAKASGFIPLETVLEIVEDSLGKKYPQLLKVNKEGVIYGYNNTVSKKFDNDEKYPFIKYHEIENEWGYQNAPIGGINPRFGSTIANDLSASREGYIPLFIQEKCIQCGQCFITCPDMVFQFKPGTYKGREMMVNQGLDYHHCKGCLRCVEICPTQALVSGIEREHPDLKWFVRNKDLIVEHLDYEDVGANSWVTSESYLDEEKITEVRDDG